MKLKLKIIFFLTFVSSLSLGQNRELTIEDYNNGTPAKIYFVNPETCEEIDLWIENDFENKTVFLFLQGGIAPVKYKDDKEFENKYGIYFHDFGCISPEYNCVIEYNNRVFDYLTEKFGEKWMKKIRKDIIGFIDWKQNYKQKKLK